MVWWAEDWLGFGIILYILIVSYPEQVTNEGSRSDVLIIIVFWLFGLMIVGGGGV